MFDLKFAGMLIILIAKYDYTLGLRGIIQRPDRALSVHWVLLEMVLFGDETFVIADVTILMKDGGLGGNIVFCLKLH